VARPDAASKTISTNALPVTKEPNQPNDSLAEASSTRDADQKRNELPFADGGLAEFSRRFAALKTPIVLDGEVPIRGSCDTIYLLAAMVQKQEPGFKALANNVPLAHKLEHCASENYFSKRAVSDKDRNNSFVIAESRDTYMAEAQGLIDSIKAARSLYWPHHGGSAVELKHFRPDTGGFEFWGGFEGLGLNRLPPEAAFIAQLMFSPLIVDMSETTILIPGSHADAVKIENTVSQQDETFYADVFFRPVGFSGEFLETQDTGRFLDAAHITVKITGVILYSNVLDQRPRLLFSTSTY
jgi:hypothetical protein